MLAWKEIKSKDVTFHEAYRGDVRVGIVQSPTEHNRQWRAMAHLLWREAETGDFDTADEGKTFVEDEFLKLMTRLDLTVV